MGELLLYKPCPSLKGEIKFVTPLNNLMGVAELLLKKIFNATYFDRSVCLFIFEALFKFAIS